MFHLSGAMSIAPQPTIAATSLSPSAMYQDEFVVETQLKFPDPNTRIPDSSGQPGLRSAAHGERPRVFDHGDSVSQSADSSLLTQPPWWSRPLSIWPQNSASIGRRLRPILATPNPPSYLRPTSVLSSLFLFFSLFSTTSFPLRY